MGVPLSGLVLTATKHARWLMPLTDKKIPTVDLSGGVVVLLVIVLAGLYFLGVVLVSL